MADEARTIPLWIPFCRDDIDGKRRPWPKIRLRALDKRHPDPPAGFSMRGPIPKTLSQDLGRTPLEILSRLAGGTTFKDFSAARSTRAPGITTLDIAGALGYVKDPLEQRLALALACQTDAEWLEVQRLAHPLIMKQLHGSHATRSLVAGKLKYRARVVLHAAFHDLALVRPPTSDVNAAKQLDMLVKDYRKLYRVVAGFIETNAQAGARTAVDALYNEE
jgi:hypothetical protein